MAQMSRLPTTGGDTDAWGAVLNDFLTETVPHTALNGNSSATTTSVTVAHLLPGMVTGSFIIIDPFTLEAEIRKITNISGNTLTVAALTYSHASGDRVLPHRGDLVPWPMWGARPHDPAYATDNVTAFNRLTNQLYGLGSYYYGGIFVPPGIWYINNELKMERDQVLQGTNTMNAKITATTWAGSTGDEFAMLHGYRDGVPVAYGEGGGLGRPSSRWSLRNLLIDGSNVTGVNGILMSPQQPDAWENLRVDNCPGYGAAISDVQQHVIENFEGIGNGTTLVLRDARFVFVTNFNSEQAVVHDVLMDTTASGSGCYQNSFRNVHIEGLVGTEHFVIDNSNKSGGWDGSGFLFDHVWFTTGATNTMFHFVDPVNAHEYELRNVRAYGTPAGVIAVEDEARSLSLNVRDHFNDRIHHFQTRWQSYPTAANPLGQSSYWLEGTGNGGRLRFTATEGTSSYHPAQIHSIVRSGNADHLLCQDGSDATVLKIGYSGAITLMGVLVSAGGVTPNSNVTAPVGSLYLCTAGGSATTLWVKESGTGNTGWVGK